MKSSTPVHSLQGLPWSSWIYLSISLQEIFRYVIRKVMCYSKCITIFCFSKFFSKY